MHRYICIHGHFYQPLRENPWLEEIEVQDSAFPYHDWNHRITAECYAPNTAARIVDAGGRISELVNNYSKISFNFGPTLLGWIERHRPDVYEAILGADRLSMERYSGHGSAMAQAYNHLIMPLASKRDKITQVRWGIADFRMRFGRNPEGMWLPETAVDEETLDILADQGIKFTILAPTQAKRFRRLGKAETWQDASYGQIDPKTAYVCRLSSGRAIALFFYDGAIAHEVAFGSLLMNGERFAGRLLGAFSEDPNRAQVVHIATDGETYGHHHRYGEMALAYCLHVVESHEGAKLTNYGEFLENHPPEFEVEILENTSWSCAHGIERWRSNCGCRVSHRPEWTQEWRKPLRTAVDWLRDLAAGLYEFEAAKYTEKPWEACEAYIEVISDRARVRAERFLEAHAGRTRSAEEKVRVLKLLEMQRHAMLMYTSCGWFFDEISGIETVQNLQHADRVLQLAEEFTHESLEATFLSLLEVVPSNRYRNGKEVYEQLVRPNRVDLFRVAAHHAISSLFQRRPSQATIGQYEAHTRCFEQEEAGRLKLIAGLKTIFEELRIAFRKSSVSQLVRTMDKHFGNHSYHISDLFKDRQREIINRVLEADYAQIESSYRQTYENNYPLMCYLESLGMPLPKPLSVVANHIVNLNLKSELKRSDTNGTDLEALTREVERWSIDLDRKNLAFLASSCVKRLVRQVIEKPESVRLLENTVRVLEVLRSWQLDFNLWEAQNEFFLKRRQLLDRLASMKGPEDGAASNQMQMLRRLGHMLCINLDIDIPKEIV
ncbi:MAG: DUF3536 domain-containing protein [Deltaproteobacteria bacterium]|nr:DUF3536 domain-containing protein [Deltaproteobacteria bacterium]